ncbi:hypothetical protein ACOSP7_019040 [Xanthoceras sorbifolium]
MFYSQTFLARKGPLGTVWCAAHLQHRLKKSHYTSTDISSTVDRIMFPEVPIALRMSGHLLLGVVRIYSKKVDYLHHDCNVVLISLNKAFTNIDLNLPEDAAQAPVHSITLPERFDLDALELDDYMYDDGHDRHLMSHEDITLTDQIPTGGDVYVAITFDEDIMMDTMHPEAVPSGGSPMEEDILRAPFPLDADMDLQGLGPNETEVLNETVDAQGPGDSSPREVPGPSNQTEVPYATVGIQDHGTSNQREVATDTVGFQDPGASNQMGEQAATVDFREPGPSNQTEVLHVGLSDTSSPQNFPEIEVMRDAVHDISPGKVPPLFSDHGNCATEPVESVDQIILNEKEIDTPILEDVFASGGQSLEFQQRSEAPPSAVSQEVPEISFRHSSPQLAIRSTPPLQQQKPRRRKRKFFDESIVLSNAIIKKGFEDASDLLRKRRNMPNSALGLWKFNNILRKDRVFQEPSITGLSADICNIFEKEYISSKPHLVVSEEAITEPMIVDDPASETEAVLDHRILQSPSRTTENIAESPNRTTENIAEPPSRTTKNTAESPSCTTEVIAEPAVAQSSSVPEFDVEIERLRYNESNTGHDNIPDFMQSPASLLPSPFRRDDMTPLSPDMLGSESVPRTGTTVGTDVLPTPDVAAFTGTHGSEFETPMTLLEEQLGQEYTGLSDIPELANSVEAEELYFLEADNSTPPGSQSSPSISQGVDSLSVRSRAVAQYLKRQSPITPVLEDPPGRLSLNNILAGKTRKLCARMFFETLVLKSYGLIDVQQEQPYGDITLSLTQKLSKAHI